MATINTIHDISRALRENPEWREEIRRELLTAELLALPDSHAALTARVDALTARVDALTIEVRALATRMDALTAKVDALTTEVRAFVEATNHRLDAMDERMDRMQYRLDRLWGAGLEAQLPNKLPTLARREFAVIRPNIVWADSRAGTGDRNPKFVADVTDAADASKITEDEYIRLRATDLIMRARRNSDGATIWFAVEASGVINTDDIDRARQSADAIKKMYEQEAVPMVYGYRIPYPQREQAIEQGVRVFIDPDD